MSAPLSEAALGARRLGLLGGSFDPPHRGHLHVADRARAAFALDHVLLVPAARPPHKPERVLAGGSERLAMLAELAREHPYLSPWAVELERSGPSYTIDTLRELRARVPSSTRLYFLLGADNLAGFPGWREAETLVRLAQPVVVARGPRPGLDATRLAEFTRTRLAIGWLTGPTLAVSSTDLRERLARGEFPPELSEPVVRHLRAHPVYAGRGLDPGVVDAS